MTFDFPGTINFPTYGLEGWGGVGSTSSSNGQSSFTLAEATDFKRPEAVKHKRGCLPLVMPAPDPTVGLVKSESPTFDLAAAKASIAELSAASGGPLTKIIIAADQGTLKPDQFAELVKYALDNKMLKPNGMIGFARFSEDDLYSTFQKVSDQFGVTIAQGTSGSGVQFFRPNQPMTDEKGYVAAGSGRGEPPPGVYPFDWYGDKHCSP